MLRDLLKPVKRSHGRSERTHHNNARQGIHHRRLISEQLEPRLLLTSWPPGTVSSEILRVDYESGELTSGVVGVSAAPPAAEDSITIDTSVVRSGTYSVRSMVTNDPSYWISGDQPRLNRDHQVLFVDLQDLVHSFKREDDASTDRHSPAAEPVPRASGCDRYALALGKSEHLSDLFGRFDAHDDLRLGAQANDLVVRVRLHSLGIDQHVLDSDDILQLLDDSCVDLIVHTSLRVFAVRVHPRCTNT